MNLRFVTCRAARRGIAVDSAAPQVSRGRVADRHRRSPPSRRRGSGYAGATIASHVTERIPRRYEVTIEAVPLVTYASRDALKSMPRSLDPASMLTGPALPLRTPRPAPVVTAARLAHFHVPGAPDLHGPTVDGRLFHVTSRHAQRGEYDHRDASDDVGSCHPSTLARARARVNHFEWSRRSSVSVERSPGS